MHKKIIKIFFQKNSEILKKRFIFKIKKSDFNNFLNY